MTFITTITKKGQITLPKELRKTLKVKPGDKIGLARVGSKGQYLKITPLPSLGELAGSFKVKKVKDPVKIREYMEKHYKRG